MEVILLERVVNLGNLGDKVSVKAGYGRNYLIPHQKAVAATTANLAVFEARRAELEAKAKAKLDAAKARADKLSGTKVTIEAQASEEGKLFGSVGIHEITHALEAVGAHVEKSEILLPDGPIHSVGEFDIGIQLHSDVMSTIHVTVVAM